MNGLISRLEALAERFEAALDRHEQAHFISEQLWFDYALPELLPDGNVKVHHYDYMTGQHTVHRSNDDCSVVTQERWAYELANPVAIA